MAISLAVTGIAFAAFCVWLTVRIVNRRERWAKWTAAAVVGLPVLYVASFGPACWLCELGMMNQKLAWIAFRPLTWMACAGPLHAGLQQRLLVEAGARLRMYATAWGDRRRTKTLWERDEYLFAFHERDVRRDDSVSPIDYEIEQSGSIDVMGMIVKKR